MERSVERFLARALRSTCFDTSSGRTESSGIIEELYNLDGLFLLSGTV